MGDVNNRKKSIRQMTNNVFEKYVKKECTLYEFAMSMYTIGRYAKNEAEDKAFSRKLKAIEKKDQENIGCCHDCDHCDTPIC